LEAEVKCEYVSQEHRKSISCALKIHGRDGDENLAGNLWSLPAERHGALMPADHTETLDIGIPSFRKSW